MNRGKRLHNKPWKRIYGSDRRYTARVDRAVERGQYTEPGTVPNVRDPEKVARKKRSKAEAEWRTRFFGVPNAA